MSDPPVDAAPSAMASAPTAPAADQAATHAAAAAAATHAMDAASSTQGSGKPKRNTKIPTAQLEEQQESCADALRLLLNENINYFEDDFG